MKILGKAIFVIMAGLIAAYEISKPSMMVLGVVLLVIIASATITGSPAQVGPVQGEHPTRVVYTLLALAYFMLLGLALEGVRGVWRAGRDLRQRRESQ